ncbi:TraB/GumN family protein [Aeromonas cavernicola]|uniref:TraB/GumN family protein n=1 Tax=Aeromonas cavernicola TaxID=1006623 RepID=A0A2H9U1T8_9GAMM|nr:TraB/GumN family protein [Aeromonas cavernicola]
MRFRSLLALLLSLCSLCALADPAFYRVNKGNQQHWLLGSIHAGTPSLYPMPHQVERAWLQSRALVLEVNINELEPAQLQGVQPLTQLPAGDSLQQHLPAPLYQRTLQAGAQYGVSEAQLAPLRPWFAALTLTQAALAGTGFDSQLGVDQHFAQLAAKTGKPVVGFETLLEQLGYLASVGEHQNLMLTTTLDELPTMATNIATVMQAWQQGDEATLITLLKEEMAPAPLQQWMERTLLAERNRNWLKKWPSLPNESFIVVGALHLYGEEGLLAQLEQQGWRITSVTAPDSREGAHNAER